MDKPKRWVKNLIKKLLGLSIFDPKLGKNNPAILCIYIHTHKHTYYIYLQTFMLDMINRD